MPRVSVSSSVAMLGIVSSMVSSGTVSLHPPMIASYRPVHAPQPPLPTQTSLPRVELDDQLFLNAGVYLIACGRGDNPPDKVRVIHVQPIRQAARVQLLARFADDVRLALGLMDPDYFARPHLVRRDIDAAIVHREEAVTYKLSRLCPRRCEAEAEDDVVQPHLQQLQKVLAGYALAALRLLQVDAELALHHTVDAAQLLLFAELHAVFGRLALNYV